MSFVVERVLDERRHALGVDDVGGEEGLHLAGDLVDRVPRRSARGRARRGSGRRSCVRPSARRLSTSSRLRWAALMSPGTSKALRALDVVLGGQAQLVDLHLQAAASCARRRTALEERLADRLVGVVDDRGDVAVVVLERVVLAAVQAALEAEDDRMARITSAPRPTAWRRRAVWRSGGAPAPPPPRRWPGAAAARGAIALVWARHPRRRTTTTAPGWAWETTSMPIGPDRFARTHEVVHGEEAGRATAKPGRGEDRRRAHGRHRRARRWAPAATRGACSGATGSCASSARAASASCGWPRTSASSAPWRSSASPCTTTRSAARAEREARAAARLAHPGIVALYEAGRDDEAVYLVSELVRGRTLAELMRDGALSDRDVLRVGVALCDALAHAHGRGVIHRDVKPGNVIVPDRPHDGGRRGQAHRLRRRAHGRRRRADRHRRRRRHARLHGARAGRRAARWARRPTSTRSALVLYEALSGVNPVRGRGAAATARRVGARLPALGRLRRDLPLELCRALDRAVLRAPRAARHAGRPARGPGRRPAAWPTTSAGRSPAARSRAWPAPAPRPRGPPAARASPRRCAPARLAAAGAGRG